MRSQQKDICFSPHCQTTVCAVVSITMIYTGNFSGTGVLAGEANDPTTYADTAALGGSASASCGCTAAA
jgi:hypothetical protein